MTKSSLEAAREAAESVARKRHAAFPGPEVELPEIRRGRPWSIPGAVAELEQTDPRERGVRLEEIAREVEQDYGRRGAAAGMTITLKRAVHEYFARKEEA
jgi:hypothetical protein